MKILYDTKKNIMLIIILICCEVMLYNVLSYVRMDLHILELWPE